MLQARPGRAAANNGRPCAPVPLRSPAGRAAEDGRARPKDMRRGPRRTADGRGRARTGRAWKRPAALLQVRGPGRIVRPSAGPIVPREEGAERAPICRLPRPR
jgi:hypothetical protein